MPFHVPETVFFKKSKKSQLKNVELKDFSDTKVAFRTDEKDQRTDDGLLRKHFSRSKKSHSVKKYLRRIPCLYLIAMKQLNLAGYKIR